MSRATEYTLGSLHGALAEHFTDMLKNGVEETDKEGNKYRRRPNAAELSVIRQLLKDNSIEALPAAGSPLGTLVDNLPFPEAGEVPFSSKSLN